MKHLAYIAVAALVLAVGIACGSPASPLAQSPTAGGCPIFPIDNVWNAPVDGLPAHPSSAAYISSIGAGTSFHPDFGSDSILLQMESDRNEVLNCEVSSPGMRATTRSRGIPRLTKDST